MLKNPISIKNVSFMYRGADFKALKEIDLEIEEGKFVVICGPTGSGKTSLIRSINGLIPHFYSGKFYGYLHVYNLDTIKVGPANLAKKVGTVFQIPENQLLAMDVERELAFALENLGYDREIIHDNIEKAISLTEINNLRHRAPFNLSGGEQQKVVIASLLALNPDILVLDEPLTNLDPKTAIEFMNLLKKLQKEHNKTILISEHRLEYVIKYADEIILIDKGKIAKHGGLDEILNDDLIYNLEVDLPPLLPWFKKRKENGDFQGKIPIEVGEQKEILEKILKNKEIKSSNVSINKDYFSKKKPKIILNSISYSYKTVNSSIKALNNISLSIFPGEIIGIVGPNGAGKSTLMRCLNGLLKPQNGKIWIKNQDISKKQVYEVSKDVGLMFQNPDHQLFSHTVLDEFKFSLKNLHLKREEMEKRIKDTINKLELKSIENKSPFNISGGQKKKVSLGSILCRDCEINVFDEPTVGQDAHQKKILSDYILEAKHKNKISIIISHDLDFIANISTRIIVMNEGEIFTEGPPDEIFSNTTILKQTSLKKPDLLNLLEKVSIPNKKKYAKIITIGRLEEILD